MLQTLAACEGHVLGDIVIRSTSSDLLRITFC